MSRLGRYSRILIVGALVVASWVTLNLLTYSTALAESGLCANCHSNKERLQGLSKRWAEVYVDIEKYQKDVHGRFACTTCHGGDKWEDSPKACIDIAMKDPSDPRFVKNTCGSCHPDITARYAISLHSTLEGHKVALVDLMGTEKGMEKFKNCSSCHANCSDCHVKKPNERGDLVPETESHAFTARPASTVCGACHGQTSTTFGGLPGNTKYGPSVMAQAGLECFDCHTEREVHSTGRPVSFINETPKPTCEECHNNPRRLVRTAVSVIAPQYDPQNTTHVVHEKTLDCVACHTGWYANCWDCHQGKATVKTYDKFFLANNPLTGKVHTAAHSPVTWEWGGIAPDVGGWAIKTRHSFGKSQTCERCHTDKEVYIQGVGREAPFVGFWTNQRGKASFVNEKVVGQIVIDLAKFKADVHKDTTCSDCHSSLNDDVCAACHEKTPKRGATFLPPNADWSRLAYMAANQDISKSRDLIQKAAQSGINMAQYAAQFEAVRSEYLEVSNEFHGNPGPAQVKMPQIAVKAKDLRLSLEKVIGQKEGQNRVAQVTVSLLVGLLGFVGMLYYTTGRKGGK
ncbi:MAG: cytochrome c3 family protein [Chloroflexi bacterium]|nr:cytochrome c3 family protein [Chloroflexota bacterium]MCL5075465.1 cytochrome c3 family protein [Chloroflexota bacterium]